ncbi:MAG: hypothetical protein AB7I09_01605 [Planctomycetota bacterium]
MNLEQAIDFLEQSWDRDAGFLGRVRSGDFDSDLGARFLERLKTLEPCEGDEISRRLVALLWYVPIFLEWQTERVKEKGHDLDEYKRSANSILSVVEDYLGIP